MNYRPPSKKVFNVSLVQVILLLLLLTGLDSSQYIAFQQTDSVDSGTVSMASQVISPSSLDVKIAYDSES
ncbi:MAG: hypothetical protein ACW98Y_21315, partial [Candidatus Thorarchaeota archaeon]